MNPLRRNNTKTHTAEKWTRNFPIVIVVLLLVFQLPIIIYQLLMFSPTAYSQEAKTLEISPPVVELALDPGKRHTQAISLKNLSNRALTLGLVIRDFVSGGRSGEPAILPEGERSKYSLAAWVTVDQPRLTLDPGSSATINATVAVPVDAEPGGHYGLVAYTEESLASLSRLPGGVAVQPGVGTLLLVRVAGAIREEGSIEAFGAGKSVFTVNSADFLVSFKNTGNVHTKPTGRIPITNLFGREVANLEVNASGGNVLPDSTREFTTSWKPGFALGRYQANLILKVGDQAWLATSGPVTFWVLPLRQIVITLLVGFVIVLTILEYNAMVAARAMRRRHA